MVQDPDRQRAGIKVTLSQAVDWTVECLADPVHTGLGATKHFRYSRIPGKATLDLPVIGEIPALKSRIPCKG